MNHQLVQSKFPQKPECNYGEVVATDRGWEVVQPSGSAEILVSCPNLKSMIEADEASRAEPQTLAPEPVVPVPTPPPAFSESELAQKQLEEEQRLAALATPPVTPPVEGGFVPPEGAPNPVSFSGGQAPSDGTDSQTEDVALYTRDGLLALKMEDIRPIGKSFKVADTSKEKLVDKIMAAQEAAQVK